MQALEQPTQVEKDFLPLNGTDHVEFYVGNARQAAYYYRAAFGFRRFAGLTNYCCDCGALFSCHAAAAARDFSSSASRSFRCRNCPARIHS